MGSTIVDRGEQFYLFPGNQCLFQRVSNPGGLEGRIQSVHACIKSPQIFLPVIDIFKDILCVKVDIQPGEGAFNMYFG